MVAGSVTPDEVGNVRIVAASMMADVEDLAVEVSERLLAAVPELRIGHLPRIVREICEANCTSVLSGLMRWNPVEFLMFTPEVEANTQEIVRARVPFTAQVRGTQLGQAVFLETWIQATTKLLDPDDRPGAILAATRYATAWADQVIQQISADYADNTNWLLQFGSPASLRLVNQLLEGDPAAARRVREQHGYELTGRHRAAVLRTTIGASDQALSDQVTAMKRSAGGPLIVAAVDQTTAWVWEQLRPNGADSLPSAVPGVHVSLGAALTDFAGFNLSHLQAKDTDKVAAVTGQSGVTRYRDVAVAALCVADLQTAQRFVDAQLGKLAESSPSVEVLRQTVGVFFAEQFNYRSTARALQIHHNTVIYRLQQAERLLGHPVGVESLTLGVALDLHAKLFADLSSQRG